MDSTKARAGPRMHVQHTVRLPAGFGPAHMRIQAWTALKHVLDSACTSSTWQVCGWLWPCTHAHLSLDSTKTRAGLRMHIQHTAGMRLALALRTCAFKLGQH
jgi:hypothetical protein